MLKLNPWDSAALVSMSNAVGELGYEDAELAYLKLALENNPENPELNRRAGDLLAERSEYDQAISCYNRVLKAKPDDRETQKAISNLSVERTIKKGRYDEQDVSKSKVDQSKPTAESDHPEPSPEEKLEKRIRKNPEDKFAYLDLGDIHEQADNLKKAEEVYQWGLKSLPEDSDMQSRLLDTQRRRLLKKVNQIKAEFEKAPKPELKEQFFAKKKELEKKTLEWNAYRVELSPNNPLYQYEYGLTLQSTGNYKEAIRDTTRQGESLLALGQCFQQIKQYPLAMKHYQQAVECLDDQQLDYKKKAYYLGAKLALGLKKYDLAEELASNLAEIDFSYKDVSDLLDKIAERSQN
jgi:tetratricopeptide (TPR) repeat protein